MVYCISSISPTGSEAVESKSKWPFRPLSKPLIRREYRAVRASIWSCSSSVRFGVTPQARSNHRNETAVVRTRAFCAFAPTCHPFRAATRAKLGFAIPFDVRATRLRRRALLSSGKLRTRALALFPTAASFRRRFFWLRSPPVQSCSFADATLIGSIGLRRSASPRVAVVFSTLTEPRADVRGLTRARCLRRCSVSFRRPTFRIFTAQYPPAPPARSTR